DWGPPYLSVRFTRRTTTSSESVTYGNFPASMTLRGSNARLSANLGRYGTVRLALRMRGDATSFSEKDCPAGQEVAGTVDHGTATGLVRFDDGHGLRGRGRHFAASIKRGDG